MSYIIELADRGTHADAIRDVRHAIFVQEQGIPAALEWARCGVRVRAPGRRQGHRHGAPADRRPERPPGGAPPERGRGVGRTLLARLIAFAAERGLAVWLSAQTAAVEFILARASSPRVRLFWKPASWHPKMARAVTARL